MATVEVADEALVAMACGGDRVAMDSLLRRHHDRIFAICRRLAGNDADAADATQEALITIVRRLDRFDGRSTFSTWSYRVATNACLDELRRRKKRPQPSDPDDLAMDSTTADSTEAIGAQMEVQAALDLVPARFRDPVVMRDLAGMEYAEIATALGIPAGTVRSRISRGRRALAGILGTKPEPTHVQEDKP